MSEEQLPDWLLSMRGQSLDEPLSQQTDLPPFPQPPEEERTAPFVESWAEEPEAEAAQESVNPLESDMVGFLRDMVQSDDEEPVSYKFGSAQEKVSGVIPGMQPWQSLVLAVLFFLDVTVCGCMALAMLQKIGF